MLYYISIGTCERRMSTLNGTLHLCITHLGKTHDLHGLDANLWLLARSAFFALDDKVMTRRIMAIHRLKALGIADFEADCCEETAKYRVLSRHILMPVETHFPQTDLSEQEQQLLQWLLGASLHLTAAELIYLEERSVRPEPKWMHEEHRNNLIALLYPSGSNTMRLLEQQMENSPARDGTVEALLGLLKKGRLTLI